MPGPRTAPPTKLLTVKVTTQVSSVYMVEVPEDFDTTNYDHDALLVAVVYDDDKLFVSQSAPTPDIEVI